MASEICALTVALGNRVLVLAPRLEILEQLIREIGNCGVPVRIIQSDRDDGPADAPVVVASIWTLALPRWQAQLPDASLVIIDECHRACAERTYGEVLAKYATARWLGLTATPARGDGRALRSAGFDDIVVAASVAELTSAGHLVPCDVLVPASDGNRLALPVVEAYQRHTPGQLAIVFATSVKHARQLEAEFGTAGIRAELVTGTTPDDERMATTRRFAAGKTRVLVNVACFVEGLDVPACSAAILARKFGHPGPYLQAIGRTLRPFPGKTRSTVVDLLGSALGDEFGPPELDRTYSLDGRGIRSVVVRDQIRQCKTCGSISLTGPTACAYCGDVYPVRPWSATTTSDGRGVVALADRQPAVRREYVVRIKSKYHGTCSECGRSVARGDEIFWATVAKKAKHVDCRRAQETAA